MKRSSHGDQGKNIKPCSDYFRDLFLENNAAAITYTTACLCTSSSKHGLFCIRKGVGNAYKVLLSAVDELLIYQACEYELMVASGNCRPGGRGPGFITELTSYPWPVVRYSIGTITFKKELKLSPSEPELMLRYTLEEGTSESEFLFKPFLAFRDSNRLKKIGTSRGFDCQKISGNEIEIKVPEPEFPHMCISATGNTGYLDSPEWRLNIKYRKTGSDNDYDTEDLYSP